MAKTNNAVTIVAGLTCSVLAAPSIGTSPQSAQLAYTDGQAAGDNLVNVNSPTVPVALHENLGGAGFVCVTNPVTNTIAVTIYIGDALELGNLLPGVPMVIPVKTGVIVKAVAATSINVGVTVLRAGVND